MGKLSHNKISEVLDMVHKGGAWVVGDSPLLQDFTYNADVDWDSDDEHAYVLEFNYHDADGNEYEYYFDAAALANAEIASDGRILLMQDNHQVAITTFDLKPTHAPQDPAHLRQQAADLLEKASALDGLSPYFIAHSHEYGVTPYLVWSESMPTAEMAADALDEQFEPHRGESLEVMSMDSMAELTGKRTLQDMEPSRADIDELDSPASSSGPRM